MTLAVFALNGIGDHVMMWPALRALHRAAQGKVILFSDTRITGYLYHDLSFLESVHITCTRLGNVRYFDTEQFFPHVLRCDTFISLISWRSPSVNTLLGRLEGRRTFGFSSDFSHPICVDGLNAFDAYFLIPQALGYAEGIHSCAQSPVHELESAIAARRRFGVIGDQGLLVVHPETDPVKDWSEANLGMFLDAFHSLHPDWAIALLQLYPERYAATRSRPHLLPVCGADFPEVASLVAGSNLFIGCDSCLLHLADLARIPTVALFRSTSISSWGCRFTRHRYVSLDRETGSASTDSILAAVRELAV